MTWLRLKKLMNALLEEKNVATVFIDQKGVVVNFLPFYWNAKNSECLPAPSSSHQENATSAAFP
jgi:hypothetical protein